MTTDPMHKRREEILALGEAFAEAYRQVGEAYKELFSHMLVEDEETTTEENPMTNIDVAARIIRDRSEVDGATLGYAHSFNIATYLDEAGLLNPEPVIVRTKEELEELPEKTVIIFGDNSEFSIVTREKILAMVELIGPNFPPLAVFATSTQLYASLEELKKAEESDG